MTLNYYEPWNLLNQMQRALRWPNVPALTATGGEDNGNVATSEWIPAVDIKEEKDRFVIHADLPGVEPDNIEITMENGILTLRGQRAHETEEEGADYRRVERIRGTFYRRFSLPDTANADQIRAKSTNGVLEVMIPKHEKMQPRKITVQK